MNHDNAWLFFIPAGLAVSFMLWVLWKFTAELAGPVLRKRKPEAENQRLIEVATASESQTKLSGS